MRRRLLASTIAIALACVGILGVPLVLVARHQVWTNATDRLNDQAESIGNDVQDRLDAHEPVDVTRLAGHSGRRVVIRLADGRTLVAGPPLRHPLTARVTVRGAHVVVAESAAYVVSRSREITLLVVALGVAAVAASVGLALWQARRFAQPLAQLAARADAFGRGEFAADPLRSGVPEIDRVAAELDRSAHQIGTFVDLQQQFASDAAHQLRTPLTSIGLHLDEISRIGDADARVEADDALAQVERLNGVITSLLARARGDSTEPELVDLAALLDASIEPWRRVLATDGRSLRLDARPGLVVRARREHLVGIMASLLDNATSHGGGDVHVSVAGDAGRAQVRVRDEGEGVPAPMRGLVFERRVSGGRGTGIGLALAASLAAAESGTLELSDRDSAEFVLTLPLVHGESVATPDQASTDTSR